MLNPSYTSDVLFNNKDNVVSEIPKYPYLIIGRSNKAFYSHPVEWYETESIANKIFSLEVGINADITAGSCGISRESANYISKFSNCLMTDAEWPLIVKRIARFDIGYMETDGLCYVEENNGIRDTSIKDVIMIKPSPRHCRNASGT